VHVYDDRRVRKKEQQKIVVFFFVFSHSTYSFHSTFNIRSIPKSVFYFSVEKNIFEKVFFLSPFGKFSCATAREDEVKRIFLDRGLRIKKVEKVTLGGETDDKEFE
jgi:hypothetical protein